jgi:hypothetical protein
MMLPILISVSLAPGSYFFSAFAALAESAAATAHAATPIRHLLKANIVLSRSMAGFQPMILRQVSQAAGRLASAGVLNFRRAAKRDGGRFCSIVREWRKARAVG